MKLEIPEKLIGDFKTFEQYGHSMREKHGSEFKRHTKLDDTRLCLYMDLYLPKAKEWVRVEADHAREDNGTRMKRRAKVDKKDLFSAVEEEKMEEK